MKPQKWLWLFAVISLAGCTVHPPQTKFNRQDWDQKEDWEYPLRDGMVNDLMKRYRLKDLSYKQQTNAIGSPQIMADTSGVYYQLILDLESDIDPVRTKYLVFKLNKDSVVTDFGIKEWERGN